MGTRAWAPPLATAAAPTDGGMHPDRASHAVSPAADQGSVVLPVHTAAPAVKVALDPVVPTRPQQRLQRPRLPLQPRLLLLAPLVNA